MSEDPKLIIGVITFELVQHVCLYGTSTSQTGRRTTYDSNTALALRTMGGKKEKSEMKRRI